MSTFCQFSSLTLSIYLVCQVKLRIQALIHIWIFIELLILSLTPLYRQYCRNTKTQPRLQESRLRSPFCPDLSETKWRKLDSDAQRVYSLVYNEGFYLGKYPSKFSVCFNLPDITGRTALVVHPDVFKSQISCQNKRYIHLSQSHPVPAKFKHVKNIETCTLLCCDHIML